jgi:Icc-related predicted phosphoesterase
MTIVAISDTHGLHDKCKLPEGDILIHAGDITEYGTEEEVVDFLHWFEKQPFTYKVFIAGNHDLFFDENGPGRIKALIPANVIYLQGTGITIEKLKIWGCPVIPAAIGMAFERKGEKLENVWAKMPPYLDILITHGPPKGVLDDGHGCEVLGARMEQMKPKLHIFGHIHGQRGMKTEGETTFINAAMVKPVESQYWLGYKLACEPYSFII